MRESMRGARGWALRIAPVAAAMALVACGACRSAKAQAAVALPTVQAGARPGAVSFRFVSNGPAGSGWDHGNKIARVYFHGQLPAFFKRTLVLDNDVPRNGSLSWIFTGPHAGFTVVLGPNTLRVFERYYDSYALFGNAVKGNYPQKITRETSVPYIGHPRTLTVVMNSHLALEVWVNGRKLVTQRCLFDVSRSQLEFNAPRTAHDVMAGALEPPRVADASITVDPQVTYQTMLGFGGSPSIPAYLSLSTAGKKRYWEILKAYNLRIDRAYPMGSRLKPDMSNLDDVADASPHYYGDNFPNGEVSNFGYVRNILAMGGISLYEMWALPSWATTIDSAGHRVANPEVWASAVVRYCQIAKGRTGHPPNIVGIQNEVTEPPKIALEMVRVLREKLDAAGFTSVKIVMADAPFLYQGTERALALRAHPDVWKSITYAASHEYDYQNFFTDPDLYDATMRAMHEASGDKPFLATEICVNKPSLQEPSYKVAFTEGQLYHKNLTILDAIGILYCWTILDVEQPSFGASRALMVPDRYDDSMPVPSSYQLRVLGAYSRHILKGMKRVKALTSDPNLLATAFKDAKGDATLVVLNRSTEAQRLNVRWNGVAWRQMERTSQYLPNIDSAPPAQLIVKPGEILTLSTVEAPEAVR